MISKEEFKSIVESVVKATGKTQEQLALEMKYGYNYISEIFTPTGKVSEKFVKAFTSHFKDVIENPTQVGKQHGAKPIGNLTLEILARSYEVLTRSHEEVVSTNSRLVRILEANLNGTRSDSQPPKDENKQHTPPQEHKPLFSGIKESGSTLKNKSKKGSVAAKNK